LTDTTPATLAPSASEKFRTRVLPFLAMAAVLAVIPLFGPSRSMYSLLNAIGINIVFALSFNMLLGRAGMLSFGHAVYFGLGGYAAMHAMNAIEAGGAFWTLAATVAMFAFTRTPLGKMGEAVRDNPQRVEFVGYDPQRVRYLVFMAAGGFAGLAGGMAAVNYEIFTPESLSLAPSGFVLLMAYVGGARYFAGPIMGAVALTYMQSNLSDFTDAWQLYLGMLFVGVVVFAPFGLAGIARGIWTGLRGPGAAARIGLWTRMTLAATLAFAGVVVVIEVLVRHTDGYGDVFTPFGQPLPSDSAVTWGLAAVLLIGGLGLMRRWARRGQEGPR